jgi:DNA-binding CsgD family transcriptional regulator
MAVDTFGRDDELRSLYAFLDRPVEGMAALVLVGEAGIGKSTLWLTGLESAQERGIRVLSARPAEVELGVAYAALGDLLEEPLAHVLPDLTAPRRRALETALLVGDEVNEPVDVRTLAVAVRDALHLLAEHESILVAIDDVQWLDASSSSALAFALRRLPAQDVRLLLARRLGDGIPVSELELAVDDRLVELLDVGPLSAGALHALVQDRLGRPLARPTLLRLHEVSGGNPFFALELARALGTVVDPTQPLPVPETLEALVRARLRGLPQATRRELLLACAHGRLTAAQLDQDALEPAFVEHVIEVANGVVRFTHPLLAAVLYQAASPQARRRAHERLAEIVEDPLARARHRALTLQEPNATLAAELEAAATVAIARGAPIVAAELFEHALHATSEDAGDVRRRRALSTAKAHLAAGEEARPRAIALELLDNAPAGQARAETLALMAGFEGPERAVSMLGEAVLEAASVPALQARLEQQLADTGRFARGPAWAEGHAQAALRIAEELDDDTLRVGALSMLATLRFDLGDADAPALADRAYELASAGGDPEQVRLASWALGHILVWSVSTDRARLLLESLYEEERDRDERRAAGVLWYLAWVELRSGRLQAAAQYAERSIEINSQYGTPNPPLFFPAALIAAHRGELERAAELAARGLSLADKEGGIAPGLAAVAGVIDLWSGDLASAVALFAQAEERADAGGRGEPNFRWWRADYVEALLELDRLAEAALVLDGWEEAARRVDRAWVLAQVTRCRGLLAAARGEVDQALATLTQAVREHEHVGDPFGRSRALLALGVTGRRARRKRPAREAIEAALAGFEECGARGWAEKARAELGAIGGRTRQEGLTAAERRVASLVAEGRTNREVASVLFLAEPTVASHLSHVYAKLGIRSRTELARKLHRF